MYDTTKAIPVAAAQGSTADDHWYEQLYTTEKGNWFLYYEGGTAMAYGISPDDDYFDGHQIIPKACVEALDWCEKHHAQDAIDKYFAHMITEA